MTATIAAGALLGAAAALPAAYLAEVHCHSRPDHPARLRIVLTVLAVAFSAVATVRHGLASTATTLLALVPATAAAVIDAHERRLPDVLNAALASVLALHISALIVLGDQAGLRATWAFVVGSAISVLTKGVFSEAIGWGDVKLAPSLAALLIIQGWAALYIGVLISCGLVLFAALQSVVRPEPIGIVAYGPALVGATACSVAIAA